MQESPDLKPDWFWNIKSFSMKKENFRYATTFQGLSRKSEEEKLAYSSLLTVRNNVGFFPAQGDSPLI